MSSDDGQVMSEVAVNGARERSDEAVAEFQRSEVNLHSHSEVKESDVSGGGKLFHVFSRRRNQRSFSFNEEIPFQFFRHVTGVGDEQTSQFFVHPSENTSKAFLGEHCAWS